MKKYSLIIALLLSSFYCQANTDFPQIKNHWLRAAPPNAMMMAAYGDLNNNTSEDKILIGAFSPDFSVVEIHKSVIKEGLAKMIHQPEIIFKAGTSLKFKPGGLHIMLMHPNTKIKIGDKIKICLIYKQGNKQNVQHIYFPVKKM